MVSNGVKLYLTVRERGDRTCINSFYESWEEWRATPIARVLSTLAAAMYGRFLYMYVVGFDYGIHA